MEDLKDVSQLIYKYLREDLSPDEVEKLQRWVQQSDKSRMFFEEVSDARQLIVAARLKAEDLEGIDLDKAWLKLKALGWNAPILSEDDQKKIFTLNWLKYAVAASLILATLTAIFLWSNRDKKANVVSVKSNENKQQDVIPNTRNATLTLANGSMVILDSSVTGAIADQGNTRIIKNTNGQIIYDDNTGSSNQNEILYNTITVPRGSKVTNILLADGSKVWLNAASSIRYPVKFQKAERRVEVTGEVLFEVAKDVSKPFVVANKDMEVLVTGTIFTINAYQLPTKVTLIEGGVKVSCADRQVRLISGQQVQKKEDQQLTVIKNADLNEATAWRNNMFYFKKSRVKDLMQEVERWYDIDVVYENGVPDETITGEAPRNISLQTLIKLLQVTNANCRIEGNKLIIRQY